MLTKFIKVIKLTVQVIREVYLHPHEESMITMYRNGSIYVERKNK